MFLYDQNRLFCFSFHNGSHLNNFAWPDCFWEYADCVCLFSCPWFAHKVLFQHVENLVGFSGDMNSVPLFHIPSDELWFTTYKGSKVMLFGVKILINMMRCHFTRNTFLIFYLMIKEAQYLKPSEMYWIWPISLSPQVHDIMKKLKLPKIDTQAYSDNR